MLRWLNGTTAQRQISTTARYNGATVVWLFGERQPFGEWLLCACAETLKMADATATPQNIEEALAETGAALAMLFAGMIVTKILTHFELLLEAAGAADNTEEPEEDDKDGDDNAIVLEIANEVVQEEEEEEEEDEDEDEDEDKEDDEENEEDKE